ncbi:hypothetical protein DENIS_0899 [Desulfonema ishimotonii]|uniref:Teneurin-like YD-shell domain-containing protein n=1 Tax=Desulfonema ishimotonii TaxID=45657 RepID=A0A401FSL8_9BACT|nr:RHS repeat-associated core domain-containing protein [Desulfonema ishimotonii]GBC59957.1 hypothetical protein DENIS_0899 [Desulfonema ishimotonii]
MSDSALTLSRDFNGYGETDREAHSVGGDQMVWEVIERDNAGRIRQKTETVGGEAVTYDYDYDEMGRLLTVLKDGTPVEEYRYDAAGRRNYELNTRRGISRTADGDFDYDDADCLTEIGDADYEYDADGFLLQKTDGADVTQYDYSLWGELLSVTLPDERFIEYVHDPLGRRIAKTADGTITEKYLWTGLTTLLAVYDGGDNLLMRFEYAGSRMPVAMTKGGTRYYLVYDQVGTLRAVTDASGNLVKRVEYDTFGNVISDSNTAFAVPFGFAGGLYDADTGLIRFGYRDYDPDTGRWTAKDPILFAGGDTDLYGYCLNDPVNLTDPEGLIFGSTVAKLVGKIMGRSAQEITTVGQLSDAAISIGIETSGQSPNIPGKLGYAADGLQIQGGYQLGMLGVSIAGQGLVSPAIPVILSGGAGWQIGSGLNNIYERFFGQSFGEYAYDFKEYVREHFENRNSQCK